jgi:hypothetical protein
MAASCNTLSWNECGALTTARWTLCTVMTQHLWVQHLQAVLYPYTYLIFELEPEHIS